MTKHLKFIFFFYLLVTFDFISSQVTLKNSNILTRKRRYLRFPKGANFVYTVVYVKILMQKVPKGVQFLHEFDMPHPLPPDMSIYSLFQSHRVHRRELFNDIATTLDRYGLNGTACVQRMVCEAKQFIPFKGKSLVKDLLSEVFLSEGVIEIGNNFLEESCDDNLLRDCPHPLLDLMWGSFTNY